jgi:hypothetical protein
MFCVDNAFGWWLLAGWLADWLAGLHSEETVASHQVAPASIGSSFHPISHDPLHRCN